MHTLKNRQSYYLMWRVEAHSLFFSMSGHTLCTAPYTAVTIETFQGKQIKEQTHVAFGSNFKFFKESLRVVFSVAKILILMSNLQLFILEKSN